MTNDVLVSKSTQDGHVFSTTDTLNCWDLAVLIGFIALYAMSDLIDSLCQRAGI